MGAFSTSLIGLMITLTRAAWNIKYTNGLFYFICLSHCFLRTESIGLMGAYWIPLGSVFSLGSRAPRSTFCWDVSEPTDSLPSQGGACATAHLIRRRLLHVCNSIQRSGGQP